MLQQTIINGDAASLSSIPDKSVNCCITSPPYYKLRDYGVDGQIGLEETPEQYITRLVEVFREVRRVLRDDGTLWINIGDSYCGSGKGASNYPESAKGTKQGTNRGSVGGHISAAKGAGIKPKDLIGIPWMLAFALRADGWYLRQDIIWSKPNPMPESVSDRCTKSHEYIFLLSKAKKYYFDADSIKEEGCPESEKRYRSAFSTGKKEMAGAGRIGNAKNTAGKKKYTGFRNKRDVWRVPNGSYRGAHFATFPEKLIEPCVLAGCPVGGVVLDPFAGSGTTGAVAKRNGRGCILVEINKDYMPLINQRLNGVREPNHEEDKSHADSDT